MRDNGNPARPPWLAPTAVVGIAVAAAVPFPPWPACVVQSTSIQEGALLTACVTEVGYGLLSRKPGQPDDLPTSGSNSTKGSSTADNMTTLVSAPGLPPVIATLNATEEPDTMSATATVRSPTDPSSGSTA